MALTFFWRCEGTTLDATHDFSAGDTTAESAFTPSIGSAAGMVGTNGIVVDSFGDQYVFDTTSGLANRLVGSMGLLFRYSSWAGSSVIFKVVGSSSAYQYGIMLAGSDEVRFYVGDPEGSNVSVVTTAANLASGTIYGIIGRWDQANSLLRIEVYSDPLGTPTLIEGVTNSSGFTAPADLVAEGGMRLGDASGLAGAWHIDNVFISDTYAEPIESNFDITSYTLYNGGGSGPTTLTLTGTLINGASVPVANATNIVVELWENVSNPTGTPDQTITGQTTDASGNFSWQFDIGGLTGTEDVFAKYIILGSPPTQFGMGVFTPDYE